MHCLLCSPPLCPQPFLPCFVALLDSVFCSLEWYLFPKKGTVPLTVELPPGIQESWLRIAASVEFVGSCFCWVKGTELFSGRKVAALPNFWIGANIDPFATGQAAIPVLEWNLRTLLIPSLLVTPLPMPVLSTVKLNPAMWEGAGIDLCLVS